MGQKGSLLVGLVVAGLLGTMVLLIAFFALPRYTNLPGLGKSGEKNASGSPTEAINQAGNIQVQANLKSLQVALISYYAEMGVYPESLNELISYSGVNTNTSNLVYKKCSDYSAFLYKDGEGYAGYVFNYEQSTPSSGSPSSCS